MYNDLKVGAWVKKKYKLLLVKCTEYLRKQKQTGSSICLWSGRQGGWRVDLSVLL